MKKFYTMVMSLLLVCSLFSFTTVEAQASTKGVDQLTSELIYYFGEEGHTDVLRTLDAMKEVSAEDYGLWNGVMDRWYWIENEMVENHDVAPNGLPDNDKHVFVVLGFALKDNGEMEDELIGRLEVALRSAEKYPNSYVLVTGGVEKNGWTEGDRMHDWLIENGLSEDRIIVENESATTVENAANSFEILYNDYDMDTFSMITSQYHLKRGSIFYYTMAQLKARELGVAPITFVGEGNAGWYRADKTEEPLSLKARGMYQISGVEPSENLPISQLEDITIEGSLESYLYEDLDVKVTATYDTDYQRDVSVFANITGFDPEILGEQNLEVSYEENGKTITKSIQVTVLEPTIDSMLQQVEKLHDNGEITDDQAARLLTTHLTAVKRYEDTGQTEKVIKHLNSFQDLLEHQLNAEQITEDAYDQLNRSAEYVLDGVSGGMAGAA
ncbi:YdcF family protein [Ornithinibacillus gellani]|uniref:YdcF family protein n=1 Tax=Ornithinibacillus gellani TaxID=2293253 RepID=UPI000F4AE2EB|nr:YdcF family protein [Ornithinibacillus gellani]TQS71143.1 YdcF family protein [Ornithinibacillus gellani]